MDVPDELLTEAVKLVDATFRAEIDRWDGNPDLPELMVHYIAQALLAERLSATERAAKIAENFSAQYVADIIRSQP